MPFPRFSYYTLRISFKQLSEIFPECISAFTIQMCFIFQLLTRLHCHFQWPVLRQCLRSNECGRPGALRQNCRVVQCFPMLRYGNDYFAPLCPGWPVHGRVLHPSTEPKSSPHSTTRERTAGGPRGVTAAVASVRDRPQYHRKRVGDNEEPQQTSCGRQYEKNGDACAPVLKL